MTKNVKFFGKNEKDTDDAPKLDRAWAEQADAYRGAKLVRRGRPKLANAKRHVSLRLDPDVVDKFKAGGPGWQSRINEALRRAKV
jgi:uncharacterized protein (DUF4415 family)